MVIKIWMLCQKQQIRVEDLQVNKEEKYLVKTTVILNNRKIRFKHETELIYQETLMWR